jgi:putative nucleotidyltransferase with HDIG domain
MGTQQVESLREEVLARAETLKVLSIPAATLKVLARLMNEESSSFGQLCEVIKHDQAITSKLISIANSAYYSRQSGVSSLERATLLIGPEEVRNIVACMTFLQDMLDRQPPRQQALAAVWTHSLKVGYAAKMLSLATMTEDPEKVFTASILHDLGKVVFSMYGEEYRRLLVEAGRTGRDLCTLERERFGIDHQEVGYLMSRKWRFPEEFCDVILRHHGRSCGHSALLRLVSVADTFSRNPEAELGGQGIILRRQKARIAAEIERISRLLGIDARASGENP